MFSSLLKMLPALTIGLGASAAAQNVAAQQQQQKAAKPVMQTVMPCGVVESDNCLARGCSNSLGGALEFDFLYWKAENRGFAYAYDQKNDLYNTGGAAYTSPNYNIGSLMRVESKFDPGFRIGAGWNTDFDRWDVFADWTWYRNHSTASHTRSDITSSPSAMGYYPIWPAEDTEVTGNSVSYQHVSATWHLWHNAGDLELGRAYYITKALSLRPHWGLRGGWLNQKFKSSMTLPLYTAGLTEYDFHGKNNFWGIGPRVGIQGSWHIDNSSWSVLGKASTSMLYGKTKVRFLTESLASGSTTFVTERDVKDHFTQLVPNLQIFLGIDWSSCLNCDRYYLGINAGWEANIYWNQFDIPAAMRGATAPFATANNHPVSMEGLTANIHLDF